MVAEFIGVQAWNMACLALLLYVPRRWLPYVAAALFAFSFAYFNAPEPQDDHNVQRPEV